MTVGDLQKYLRNLADAIGAATRSPAKDLLDAADRLSPFAQHQLVAFTEFLKLADEYRTTGKLPEPGKKPAKPKVEKSPKLPKPTKAQPTEMVALVESLRNQILADPSLTREKVEIEVRAFQKRLSKDQWLKAAELVGFTSKPKTIEEAIQTLVGHVMARRGGVERADA